MLLSKAKQAEMEEQFLDLKIGEQLTPAELADPAGTLRRQEKVCDPRQRLRLGLVAAAVSCTYIILFAVFVRPWR
jgi:hypothetical protein